MRLLRSSILSLLASSLVFSAALAETSVSTSTSVSIKSCTRISDGKEKAQCEWENHEMYLKMNNGSSSSSTKVTSGIIELNLPNCRRIHDDTARIACELANHLAQKQALQGLVSSKSSSSKPTDACRQLKGLKKFACLRKLRMQKKTATK